VLTSWFNIAVTWRFNIFDYQTVDKILNRRHGSAFDNGEYHVTAFRPISDKINWPANGRKCLQKTASTGKLFYKRGATASKARPPAVLIANSHRQKPTRQKCLVALRRAVWTGFKSCASESTLNAVAFTSRSSVNLSANTLFRCRRCREHENGRTKYDAFWDTCPVRTAAKCSRIYDHIACKSHRGALSTERWLQSIRKVVPWDTGNTTAESKDLLTARKLSWTNSSSLHTCIPMECLQQTRVQSAGWGRKLRHLSMAY